VSLTGHNQEKKTMSESKSNATVVERIQAVVNGNRKLVAGIAIGVAVVATVIAVRARLRRRLF
jgi:hypothetical protein